MIKLYWAHNLSFCSYVNNNCRSLGLMFERVSEECTCHVFFKLILDPSWAYGNSAGFCWVTSVEWVTSIEWETTFEAAWLSLKKKKRYQAKSLKCLTLCFWFASFLFSVKAPDLTDLPCFRCVLMPCTRNPRGFIISYAQPIYRISSKIHEWGMI